ncbi:uncharacterized protein LOC102805039 [Saccoglossus kowalevskii]|uniref:Uncharacterized protein LOC102805039 n=1 Tax=Saccoglossus kowalevskii TaxID=10224 RepID=A0ABM0MZV2_SACKO|nr:PREDICTED: uncharacterized protein LOC102805039 [Saccoglossus kowalevskii]
MGSGASKPKEDVPNQKKIPSSKLHPKDKSVTNSKSKNSSPKKMDLSPSKTSNRIHDKQDLVWSPSIDSDLEQDGEDLQALQGELDQVLVGHQRALSRNQTGNPPVFNPRYKSDWQMPADLARQEQELLNVYNSTKHGTRNRVAVSPRQNGDNLLIGREPHNGDYDARSPQPGATEWDFDCTPVQNGFDPIKFKAANMKKDTSEEKVNVEEKITYTTLKEENKGALTVTSPLPPSRNSKRSIHYDVSEEELMASIEQQFDL